MANCPYCKSPISAVTTNDVTVGTFGQNQWHGVGYACPSCNTLLGVGIDPVALKTDTVREVIKALKARP